MATNGIQEQMNESMRRLEQQNEMIVAMQENLRNEQRRAEAAEERTREAMRAGQQQVEVMQNLLNTAQETYQRNLEEVREKTSRERETWHSGQHGCTLLRLALCLLPRRLAPLLPVVL